MSGCAEISKDPELLLVNLWYCLVCVAQGLIFWFSLGKAVPPLEVKMWCFSAHLVLP